MSRVLHVAKGLGVQKDEISVLIQSLIKSINSTSLRLQNSVNREAVGLWRLTAMPAVFAPPTPPQALRTEDSPSANNLHCKSSFLLPRRICISTVFRSACPRRLTASCSSVTRKHRVSAAAGRTLMKTAMCL